jgi:hypothetical protein
MVIRDSGRNQRRKETKKTKKLLTTAGVVTDESFGWHIFLDTVSAFIKASSYLLAGEGVWGKRRRLSPRPQQLPCRNLFVVLFVHKNQRLSDFYDGPLSRRQKLPLTRRYSDIGSRLFVLPVSTRVPEEPSFLHRTRLFPPGSGVDISQRD